MPTDHSGIRTHFSNTGLNDMFLLPLLKCNSLKTWERNMQRRGTVAAAQCSAQTQNSHRGGASPNKVWSEQETTVRKPGEHLPGAL